MIGTSRPSHQCFPIAAALLWALGGCSGGGGGGSSAVDLPPTILAAAFVGVGATPAAGDSLMLFFSENVSVVGGTVVTDTDVVLSGNATLGSGASIAATATARTIAVVLGTGVALTPNTTTIGLAPGDDVFRDSVGQFGTGGTPVTITQSDGTPPTMSRITIASIDPELNGTGPAGGQLQVPVNGWTIDLQYADNSTIDTTKTTITASVAVATPAGAKTAGANLQPFLTVVSATSSAASYLVPAAVQFPPGVFTLRATVVDSSGLGSNEVSFTAAVRPFSDALRPFETIVNSQQVWYLDFSRDIESFTTTSGPGGAAVAPVAGANGLSDFEDILRVVGLNSASPIAVSGSAFGSNSNDVVLGRFKAALLAQLADLYSGVNVSFTLTQPSGSFNGNSSLPYNSFPYSQISIAGSSTMAGVLGIAIFDPSNTTQNDNTRTDFGGNRLGVFLHTIVDAGMGPPSSSAFRQTFNPFAMALGGTPIGGDASDGMRLAGTLVPPDTRNMQIDQAIADLARFTAVVTGHECGHSVGLVENGPMPVGLYGNDPNFPGSTDGHIRTPNLFPAGATNAMSPSLSYSSAIHPASGFNSLNKAYLREQVFYGN
ncbi:MAG TPA: hypothetical protein VFZ65_00150 [Planctomycetota bacterium]|nr:hypothetical protein [Planctomycetota bacterium]